jgi:hypothetical protein
MIIMVGVRWEVGAQNFQKGESECLGGLDEDNRLTPVGCPSIMKCNNK